MASNLKTIADIFERKLFRIPDYQRGYSWEDPQLNDFWDDLDRLIDGKSHYTGLLTLEKANLKDEFYHSSWLSEKWLIENSGYEPYYIVDGQQRLTTIIILLQTILKKINDKEELNYTKKENLIEKYIKRESGNMKSYIFDYTFNDPSSNYLKRTIFDDKSVDFNSPMTVYTRNLENAETFFSTKLENVPIGVLENLFRKATLKLQFNVYEIEDELDVFVTFETTNNRGKALTRLELLKNRLIFLSTIIPNNNVAINKSIFEEERKELRSTINQAWKTIYEYLGKNKDNLLDDDEFLMYHYYMYFGYNTDDASRYGEILLNTLFTTKKAQKAEIGITDIAKYVNSLRDSVVKWFIINNPYHESSLLSPETAIWLARLNRMKYASFFPCLMAAFQIPKVTDKHLIDLMQSMERYIFLVFRISQRRSNTGRTFFYSRAKDVFNQTKDIYELIYEIKSRTDDQNIGHDSTMKKFQDQIIELFQSDDSSSLGYTEWEGIRYLLFEYELYLQGDNENRTTWELFNRSNTIEHIYPRTPKEECWEQAFKPLNFEKRKTLLHSLGNLLLLSKKKNSQQQNFCFEYKKRHQSKFNKDIYEGYFNGSYSEIEVSQYNNWSAKEILERGLLLLTFMEKRWNITIGDNNKKISLLMLDFMNE